MKIGIACVYYAILEDHWIFELQRQKIREHTKRYNYTIYATDIRLDTYCRNTLKDADDIKLYHLDLDSELSIREHGESLTKLINLAVDDDYNIVITLDADSFPISEDWIEFIKNHIDNNDGVASIQRTENYDKYLPHPSGTALTKNFIKKYNFKFYPENEVIQSASFQRVLEKTGPHRIDTDIGLG